MQEYILVLIIPAILFSVLLGLIGYCIGYCVARNEVIKEISKFGTALGFPITQRYDVGGITKNDRLLVDSSWHFAKKGLSKKKRDQNSFPKTSDHI